MVVPALTKTRDNSGVSPEGYAIGSDDHTDLNNLRTWCVNHEDASAPHSGHLTSSSLTSSLSNMSVGDVRNLGITLSSGTLIINAADGSALSSTNIGCVCCPSTTAGRAVVLSFTANVSFCDDAHASTHDLAGILFGIDDVADLWNEDLPFFIYVVNKDDTAANAKFAISRNPCASKTPDTTNQMSYKSGGAPASNFQNVFVMIHTTSTAYTDKPCVPIGAFRMQLTDAANNDWTISTLSINDGIGSSYIDSTCATMYTLPTGQNGAETGKTWTSVDGATALNFATTNYAKYFQRRDGSCTLYHYHTSQSANGADGTYVKWYSPLAGCKTQSTVVMHFGDGRVSLNTAISNIHVNFNSSSSYGGKFFIAYQCTDGTQVLDNEFAHTDDYIYFQVTFQAFSADEDLS